MTSPIAGLLTVPEGKTLSFKRRLPSPRPLPRKLVAFVLPAKADSLGHGTDEASSTANQASSKPDETSSKPNQASSKADEASSTVDQASSRANQAAFQVRRTAGSMAKYYKTRKLCSLAAIQSKNQHSHPHPGAAGRGKRP
jgi:hypothetical protein